MSYRLDGWHVMPGRCPDGCGGAMLMVFRPSRRREGPVLYECARCGAVILYEDLFAYRGPTQHPYLDGGGI